MTYSKFNNFIKRVLIQEIKINLENSFEWWVMTPSQIKEFGLIPDAFYKVFYFNVNEYVYIATYNDNGEFHFWNHTIAITRDDEDDILNKKISIFSDMKNVLKMVATFFSIFQFIEHKGIGRRFVIIPPDNEELKQRFIIYKNIIDKNYKTFLPNYEMNIDGYNIILEREMSINEKHKINVIRTAYGKTKL